MKIKSLIISSFLLFTITNGSAQRLDRFGGTNRISYGKTSSYFGYADSLSKPDEVRNDTGYYFMYFWLNDSVSELAARIISPVPDVVMPDRGDLVSPNYYENEKDKTTYFDPYMVLERAEGISVIEEPAKLKLNEWTQLGFNDDSSELFPQPSGNRYNSLLRINGRHDVPGKPLLAGLYRIRFTSYKKGHVKGSYLIQVATQEKLPTLRLVKKQEELKD